MRLIRADQVLQLADAIEPRWRLESEVMPGLLGRRLWLNLVELLQMRGRR